MSESELSAVSSRPAAGLAKSELRDKLSEQLSHLRSRALRLCKNPDEADDLVHDTVLRALAFEGSYRPETNLRGWLQQVLFSVFITRCRRRRRERRALERLTFDPCSWTHPDAPAPARELGRSVVSALSALPPQFRAVVELVDLEELAYRDAAAKLHVPVGTVMSRLFRGRRLLAGLLEAAPKHLPEAA